MNKSLILISAFSFLLLCLSALFLAQFLPESVAPGLIFCPQIRQIFNVFEASVIAITSLMLSLFSASFICPRPGLRVAIMAGSLGTLLLTYPTYEIYTRSLLPDTQILEDPKAFILKCLPGIMVILCGILFKPRLPGSGFVRGFIIGLIPTTFLGYALLLAGFIHPLYIRLVSNPAGSLGDCLFATMQTMQLLVAGNAALFFVPVLTGLMARIASKTLSSTESSDPIEGNWSFKLVGPTMIANLTLVVLKVSVSNSILSFNNISATTGFVSPLGPAEMIDTLAIFPIIAFNFAVCSLMIFKHNWCIYGKGLNAYLISFSIAIGGFIGNEANQGLKATGILQMLLGTALVILVWHRNRKITEENKTLTDDSYAIHIALLGPLTGFISGTVTIMSLTIGLGFVGLLASFTDGGKAKIFTELRAQSPLEEVWLYGTCILAAYVLAIVAIGFGGRLKKFIVAKILKKKPE